MKSESYMAIYMKHIWCIYDPFFMGVYSAFAFIKILDCFSALKYAEKTAKTGLS